MTIHSYFTRVYFFFTRMALSNSETTSEISRILADARNATLWRQLRVDAAWKPHYTTAVANKLRTSVLHRVYTHCTTVMCIARRRSSCRKIQAAAFCSEESRRSDHKLAKIASSSFLPPRAILLRRRTKRSPKEIVLCVLHCLIFAVSKTLNSLGCALLRF